MQRLLDTLHVSFVQMLEIKSSAFFTIKNDEKINSISFLIYV